MLNIFIATAFLALGQSDYAQQLNCEDPKTQMEMNACAGEDYRKADAELNTVWSEMKAYVQAAERDYSGQEGWWQTMLESQRVWLKYRDLHCRAEGYSFEGGSMQPMVMSYCKAHLTNERIKALKNMKTP